jgi:hypothetical protein
MLFGSDEFERLNGDLNSSRKLQEAFLTDDLSRLPSEQLKEFCESEEAKALVEANVLRKPTLVRLSKKDDFTRRVKIAAFEICKEENPTLWKKLAENRVKEKKLINQIMTLYRARAIKRAKAEQTQYIKTAKKVKFPVSFKKAGGEDR